MATNNENELKPIASLKDLQEDGPAVSLNLDEDAWSFGAPPPHDVYSLKCFPGKEFIKIGKVNPKDAKSAIYIVANLECKVVSDNEEYDGTTAFVRLSTRVGRGKNISTMAGFLVKLGYKETLSKAVAAGKLTDKLVAQYLEAALKKEPVIKAECDWRGSYSFTNAKGEEEWVNKFNHYEEFPENPEKPGTKLHTVMVQGKDKENHEVRAQFQVVKFFGKGEEIPDVKKGKTGGIEAGPKLVMASDLNLGEPEAEKPKTSQAASKPSADDDSLILE